MLAAVLAIGSLPATAAAGQATGAVGDAQSPIDIRREDVTFVHHLPDLRFQYPKASLEVINTGSPDPEATIRAVVNSPATLRVNEKTYHLTQFHFHTTSEHRLNGKVFPRPSCTWCMRPAHGALLVVGVFIEVGHRNSELQRIFRDLPADEQTRLSSAGSISTS